MYQLLVLLGDGYWSGKDSAPHLAKLKLNSKGKTVAYTVCAELIIMNLMIQKLSVNESLKEHEATAKPEGSIKSKGKKLLILVQKVPLHMGV